MEIDISDESNRSSPSTEENGSHLRLVQPDESGDGLPYAPENWPNPGDIWTWRVGKRVASTGHYLDRYLYLPSSLCHSDYSTRKKNGFASKLSVENDISEQHSLVLTLMHFLPHLAGRSRQRNRHYQMVSRY
jgi:hypothetical protein